jgi:hypothetical protein
MFSKKHHLTKNAFQTEQTCILGFNVKTKKKYDVVVVEEALKRNQASAGIKGSRQGVQTARTHQKNREKLKLRCENGRRVNCLPNHHTPFVVRRKPSK